MAKDFTKALVNFIVHNNKHKLNPDGKGCSVETINIVYQHDYTTVTVGFSSNDSDVNSFTCSSSI